MLENQSYIIFQDYDSIKERFVDAYWIRSIDDIFRMKYLYPFKETPVGEYVDHLQRNQEGKLILQDSHQTKVFPEIHFNSHKLTETLTQPQDLSMTALHEKRPAATKNLSEKEAQILSVLYYKIVIPWLCLLAVIAPAPVLRSFHAPAAVFFIYALSIFGLVAFYLIMDAALILGSRQVFNLAWQFSRHFSLFWFFFLPLY